MTSVHQNLLGAAARLIPWGGLLGRLSHARVHSMALPRAGTTARAVAEPVTYVRPAVLPARASRQDTTTRQAILPSTPRQARAMLRVVRVVETDQPSASSGRIVMCGRMADVCAELDRMVAHEAAQLARA